MEEGCYNNCNFTDKLYFRGILGVNMKNQEPGRKISKVATEIDFTLARRFV